MQLFRKKSVEELTLESEETPKSLKRTLGPLQLISLGIGVVIGAGLFSITGIAAAENAGPAIVLAFIIASLGCTFAGLSYCELTSMIPLAGSAYTYAYATLGELVAWIIGWDLILEYAVGAATVSISWSAYLVSLLHDFSIDLPYHWISSPWQKIQLPSGEIAYGYVNIPAVLINCLLSYLLILGIKKTSYLNSVMVTVKLLIVLIFIGLGYFYIKPENHIPFIPPNQGDFGAFGLSGILKAAGVIFFAYIGFDAVSTAAQEAKNPSRTVPIGILGSLLICTILYVLFAYVLTGLVPYKELDVAAPVAKAIDQTPYHWLSSLIKLAIIAGFTSVILVLLLGQSRIFYAMSKDGLLPSAFSQIHPRFRSPWISNLTLMLFSALFGGFAPLSVVGHMTSIGTLFAFILVSAGVIILRYTHPELKRPFRAPLVPLTPILGILICLTLMVSLGPANWIRLGVWLAFGLIIYACYGYRHSTLHKKI